MVSNVNPTYPVAVSPTTASVRGNFQAAHDEITALQTSDGAKLPLAGGTMTGPIVLAAPPAAAMQAANRGYVDGGFLPLAGGTLTGATSATVLTIIPTADANHLAPGIRIENPLNNSTAAIRIDCFGATAPWYLGAEPTGNFSISNRVTPSAPQFKFTQKGHVILGQTIEPADIISTASLGGGAMISALQIASTYTQNMYMNASGNWVHLAAGWGALFSQDTAGNLDWYTDSSKAAGAIQTWTGPVMQLIASGYLSIDARQGWPNGQGDDPLNLVVASGRYCRVRTTVAGTRTWSAGPIPDGRFCISDETAPATRFIIDASGNVTVVGTLVFGGATGTDMQFPAYGPAASIGFSWDNTYTTFNCYIAGGFQGYIIRAVPVTNTYIGLFQMMVDNTGAALYMWWPGGGVAYVGVTAVSDRRYKTNVRATEFDALDVINRLPVYEADITAPWDGAPTAHWDCTIMADEVQELIPAAYLAAAPDLEGQGKAYDSVRDLPLITTLIRAMQQLLARVVALESSAAPAVH